MKKLKNEPVFTDDDLKRLKDYYEDPKRGDTPLKWKALLASLEAAEHALDWAYDLGCRVKNNMESVAADRFFTEYEAWQKSAGK